MDEAREITPVLFFGLDNSTLVQPGSAAQRKDFRPRPIPSAAPMPAPTPVAEEDSEDDDPKASSATDPATSSDPDSPALKLGNPEQTAPVVKENPSPTFGDGNLL